MNVKFRYRIVVVGAGGTGSHFIARFSQFLASVQNHTEFGVVVVDGDHVEDSNLSRQVFSDCDVLQNKAEALTLAVAETYGLDFMAFPHYLDSVDDLNRAFSHIATTGYANENSYTNVNICIGACDNHRCRQVMEEWFQNSSDAIYIDAANEFSVGEVVTAIKTKGKIVAPPRSYYFPEVLTDNSLRRSEESCGAINVSAPQHIATNMEAANIMLAILSQLIQDNKISGGVVYFDTFAFTKVFRRYEGGVIDATTDK